MLQVATEYALLHPDFKQESIQENYNTLVSRTAALTGIDLIPDCEEEGLFFWQHLEKYIRPKTLARKDSIIKIRRVSKCQSVALWMGAWLSFGKPHFHSRVQVTSTLIVITSAH